MSARRLHPVILILLQGSKAEAAPTSPSLLRMASSSSFSLSSPSPSMPMRAHLCARIISLLQMQHSRRPHLRRRRSCTKHRRRRLCYRRRRCKRALFCARVNKSLQNCSTAGGQHSPRHRSCSKHRRRRLLVCRRGRRCQRALSRHSRAGGGRAAAAGRRAANGGRAAAARRARRRGAAAGARGRATSGGGRGRWLDEPR